MNPSEPMDVSRPRVLVVDDERAMRLALELMLRPHFAVVPAPSVDEGERLMRELSPDLVVMDYMMPGRNGIEGLRAIRSIDRKVPVIFLTGYADSDAVAKAFSAGADEFMRKPVDVRQFPLAVRRLIDARN